MNFDNGPEGHLGARSDRVGRQHKSATFVAKGVISFFLSFLSWMAPATAGQWGNTARCDEGALCNITEPSMLYFGADVENNVRKYDRGRFVGIVPAQIPCTHKEHGDPAPGVKKECRIVPWSRFKKCAVEGQKCIVPGEIGALAIAYGQGSSVVPRVTNSSGTACIWQNFPNPNTPRGTQNWCMAASLEPGKKATDIAKLNYFFDSAVVENITGQIQTAHAKFMNYKWRTVYKLEDVPKQTGPGTRKSAVKQADWSQLDAEAYLVNTLGMTNLPAFNCQASVFGGPLGRSIQVTTISGRTVTVSDAQINALLVTAFEGAGQDIFNNYLKLKTNFCGAIYNAAQLHFRTQRYNDFKAAQQTCKDDGIQMMGWQMSDKINFGTDYNKNERTVAIGGGMNFHCGKIYNGSASDAITYDSWFKWSDSDRVPVNLIKTLIGNKEPEQTCPVSCIPLIKTGSLGVDVCLDRVGDAPIVDSVPMKFGARIDFARTKYLCTPVINVPAPYGYAQSLSEMGEDGKEQLQALIMEQLKALMPDTSGKMSNLIATIGSIAE